MRTKNQSFLVFDQVSFRSRLAKVQFNFVVEPKSVQCESYESK